MQNVKGFEFNVGFKSASVLVENVPGYLEQVKHVVHGTCRIIWEDNSWSWGSVRYWSDTGKVAEVRMIYGSTVYTVK